MGRSTKITDDQLLQAVSEGLGGSEIARRFKVAPSTVSTRLKRLNVTVGKDISLRSAPKVVDKQIDAVGQLQKINSAAHELLDLLMAWTRGEPEAIRIMESQVKKIAFGEPGPDGKVMEFDVREAKMKDPRELALKCMAEIRGQLKLQLEIFQALYDMQAVAEFQKTVLEVIASVDPAVRDEIVRRLAKARAVRSSLDLDAGPGRG